jgi:hypothetical protein
VERCAVDIGDDGDGSSADILGTGLLELGLLVACDAEDVVHHGVRIPEDVRVEALVDIADGGSALAVSSDIGLVDVADFARLHVEEIPVDVKFPGNVPDFRDVVGRHRVVPKLSGAFLREQSENQP